MAAGDLVRVLRGFYTKPPTINSITKRPNGPDYDAIIRAVARRDQVRMIVDGMTAANDLGLTTAVPAHVVVLVDARLKPIWVNRLKIRFKQAAPSRLYWAGRPGMRVVQALYWMQDLLADADVQASVVATLQRLFADPTHGKAIRDDLRGGLTALPIWMQDFLRALVQPDEMKVPA